MLDILLPPSCFSRKEKELETWYIGDCANSCYFSRDISLVRAFCERLADSIDGEVNNVSMCWSDHLGCDLVVQHVVINPRHFNSDRGYNFPDSLSEDTIGVCDSCFNSHLALCCAEDHCAEARNLYISNKRKKDNCICLPCAGQQRLTLPVHGNVCNGLHVWNFSLHLNLVIHQIIVHPFYSCQ